MMKNHDFDDNHGSHDDGDDDDDEAEDEDEDDGDDIYIYRMKVTGLSHWNRQR